MVEKTRQRREKFSVASKDGKELKGVEKVLREL